MALLVGSAAPRRGQIMGTIAAGMALARVSCGLHYPSDVLAGAIIGAVVAWGVHSRLRL